MRKSILLCTLVLLAILSCQLETNDMNLLTNNSGMEVKNVPDYEVGNIWLSPNQKTVPEGHEFKTKLFINTGTHMVGAVAVQIAYNPQIIEPNLSLGDKGVETDVFVPPSGGHAVNILTVSETESRLFIVGYLSYGVEPAAEAYLFSLNWIALEPGETEIVTNVISVIAFDSSYQYYTPGVPTGFPCAVTIF